MQKKIDGFSKWYKKYIGHYIPEYAFFSLIACFVVNCLVYWFTQFIISDMHLHDFTTSFDRAIPFMPEWVLIYILSYPFWVISYIIIARYNTKEFWFKFVTADMIARVVCGFIFLLIPTTNIRPIITDSGVWDKLMEMIYFLDQPTDLFPSIHCLASLMCYLGMRKNENVAKWYRVATLVFAILVFASTQFTKQHYIVDVIGGVVVAVLSFAVAKHTNWYEKVMYLFDKLTIKAFRGTLDEVKQKNSI